jgi:single-strand DNA-binding protein
MAGEPVISLVGNLVADPELHLTSNGSTFAKFRIASTPRHFDRQTGDWRDGDSIFLTCNVWRQMAENVGESLRRGMRVIVVGRLRQRSYQNDKGENTTTYEVEVDEVGPSIRYTTARVIKNARLSAPAGSEAAPAASGDDLFTSGASPRDSSRAGREDQKVPF